MVLRAKESEGEAYRNNLDTLIRTYWRPVYDYLRRKWGKSNEDSKDLTQAFFADLLGRPFLERVSPEKGRFRTFLLSCLKNFLHKQHDAKQALKRGGGKTPIPLDFVDAAEPVDARTPEEAFERSWEQAVVRETVRRLQGVYEKEDRGNYFTVFRKYDLEGDARVSYAAVAKELRIRESDVTNFLSHARTRFRDLARDVVRDSLSDEGQLSGEMKHLFGAQE